MESNPYAAPLAELEEPSNIEPTFYVVGIRKFSILFVSTLGFYSIYWFYANWKGYKEKYSEKIWPIARAIFSIFFAHSLFSKVQEKLDAEKQEYEWSPGSLATIYVVLTIAGNVVDRLSMKEIWSPNSDILSLVLVLPLFYTVLVAQRAINYSEGDTEGASNNTLTWVNYLWVLLGVVLWILSVLGVLLITGVIIIDA